MKYVEKLNQKTPPLLLIDVLFHGEKYPLDEIKQLQIHLRLLHIVQNIDPTLVRHLTENR